MGPICKCSSMDILRVIEVLSCGTLPQSHRVYNTAENLNTIYNHSNVYPTSKVTNLKITSFYTQLNNSRLQEFDLICANGDEWTLLNDSLAGSSLLSSNMYYYNWFWRESFEHVRPTMNLPMKPDSDNLIKGLPLDFGF